MSQDPQPKTIRMLIRGLDRLIRSAHRQQSPSEQDLLDLTEMIRRREDLANRLQELGQPVEAADNHTATHPVFSTHRDSSSSATLPVY